ncbi:MAG: hypothetical protein HOJ14_02320 [Nitrospina sp.]|nr:hypothetical protein [Nitrospina sp.]
MAQIDKLPAHLMQEKKDTFQSLDREMLGGIANTRKRQVEERSHECTIALEKFLDRFEDMHAAQATEKVRRSVDSVDNLPVMSSLGDALCPGGTQQPMQHDEDMTNCISEGEFGPCLEFAGTASTQVCGTQISLSRGMYHRRGTEVELRRMGEAMEEIKMNAETTARDAVRDVVNTTSGEAYEAIENLREAVSTFRDTVGGESCGLKPPAGIGKKYRK